MSAEPTAINIPPDEGARQADAALQGYVYQLYQSVLAWLSLGPNEVLHIEFAEDFAVSDDGTLSLTQVKHTKAALTLRSKAVSALIGAVWAFQDANPERSVVAALITTEKIGKERRINFPGNVSGLSYWRVAAREHADIEPMRAALLQLDLPAGLKSFLKGADADYIRRRILRPIRWLGSGPSQDEIERDLHDRLVYFGATQGVGAEDSKKALNALIVELLKCAQRAATLRFVTAADLLTVFQKNTYILIPPSAFQGMAPSRQEAGELADAELAARDAASIPLPPRAAHRPALIEDLHGTLVASGTLWLHGSSGLGKTTVALLLARYQSVLWIFADLRDLKPRALRLALARLSATFAASGARGLILDDLPADADNVTVLAVRRVARTVATADGVLVVTATRPPPPTLAGGLGLVKGAVRALPYLTEDDVGQVVTQAGGDRLVWGHAVFLFCGGHPQLVDARVMGLRQRGWPAAEQLAKLTSWVGGSGDLENERTSVRTRLLLELDAESRELLLRLSLLINNFDRSMMFAVVNVPPAVPQAGMRFDALVGPWIEQVGPERYRLSPLLRNSGDAGFAEAQRREIRTAVVNHLMNRRPFPADQLSQLFLFAFGLNLIPALSWFAGVLVHAASRKPDLFKRLAEEVSIFAMTDRGEAKLLVPENPNVSFMLRYAQFRVAIATEDGKRAAKILDRMLLEIEHLTGEFRSNSLGMVLTTALTERSVPLSPRRWLNMLQTLVALPEWQIVRRPRPSRPVAYSGLTVTTSADEMMFIIRATALSGIDQLCELVETLDATEPATRERYLTAASNLSRSTGHIVASAWLSSVRTKGFDGRAAAAKLAVLYETASLWKNTDFAVELACAQAVMLDEYAGDKNGALEVLSAAQGKHPRNYRINRQRQKVYSRSGDHALAVAEFESFANALPAANPIDRVFALREAARSAAEVGELDKTRIFFEQAWEAARSCGDTMLPMKAGLSADCAIVDFQAGRIQSALTLMLRALNEAEAFDPKAGLKEHYCALILMAAILWMRGAGSDWPLERQAMMIGMCSNPDPPPEIRERPLPQSLLPWYELAELEAESSSGQAVLTALRQRTCKGGLLPMEQTLAVGVLRAAVRDLNTERFVEGLAIYPRAVVQSTSKPPERQLENVFAMPTGFLKPIAADEWKERSIREATTSAVLAFLLAAVCSGQPEVPVTLREQLRQNEALAASLTPLFDTLSEPSENRDDIIIIVASVLGRMLRPDFVFDAAEAFMATVYFVQFLADDPLGEMAAGPVVGYFAHVWRDIFANRTFSVRNPVATGPFILSALSKGISNRAKLANIVLASEFAVRAYLGDELRAKVRAMADSKRMSLADLQVPVPSGLRP